MNEQQLQQILTIQQAIAAAATAAVINSLLNPQQQAAQAGLTNANALTDQINNELQQQQHQQQSDSRQQSPLATSSPANNPIDSNNQIQELLLRLQQQANATAGGGNLAASALSPASAAVAALNLNMHNQLPSQLTTNLGSTGSPVSRSPVSGRLLGQQMGYNQNPATSSSNIQQSNQSTPNKKLKTKHHQPTQPFSQQANRSSMEATSKPQQSTPKSHSTVSNLTNRTNSSSTNSSSFMTNNVGLPRKLVRGQDVWLGRGAEQTRQILKCMWCGQSFRTLAEMTQHMKVTQHYTNIISQEQITSWRQPDNADSGSSKNAKQSAQAQSRNPDDNDDFSFRSNDSDEEMFSNDDEAPIPKTKSKGKSSVNTTKRESPSASDNLSLTGSPQQLQSTTTAKPLTRSARRENKDSKASAKSTKESSSRENSPASVSSSSSSQRQQSNSVLGDLNEESEINRLSKNQSEIVAEESSRDSQKAQEQNESLENVGSPVGDDIKQPEDEKSNDESENIGQNLVVTKEELSEPEDVEDDCKASLNDEQNDSQLEEVDNDDEKVKHDINDEDNDNSDKTRSKRHPKRRLSDAINTNAASNISKPDTAGPKSEGGLNSGDPLSALETMVEKSFDPRLRPGVANGGILQRLGIDEEVCPPWQHINYANWYAAAAYGHPMAAALLAAGINLQNGIKLNKNVGSKKGED